MPDEEKGRESAQRIREKLRKELGPIVRDALEDPSVVDIIANSDGQLWIHRLGQKKENAGYMSSYMIRAMLGTVASVLGTEIN